MKSNMNILMSLILLSMLPLTASGTQQFFSVTEFGAVGDGKVLKMEERCISWPGSFLLCHIKNSLLTY